MPFTQFDLHPDLLRGIKELGYTRPTPIQSEAIPPAMQGRDVLGCAQTGSGKTVAFLLPILNKLMAKKRGVTRALVITPTRELAAQIEQSLTELCVHTPLSGAAVFGGVGMGPQEHAFRVGVDVIVATPGRLLDHFKQPYAKLDQLEFLVLDEADRMLDMGFLPDIKRVLKHLPPKRQTFFFSATMPAPIHALVKEMLHDPVTINMERQSKPAVGITQAIYPVKQDLKPHLFLHLVKRGELKDVIVFCRTKHRANRLADFLLSQGVAVAKIHGNRSQAQRTDALAGFKKGTYQVLVATDIVARGIDVEELGHVVNFDVPAMPEDYIHRVGRTARAEATGDAFTFVSPEEEPDLRAIERAVGKPLRRVTVPDFDYNLKPEGRFEVPIAERIAAIRARKADERGRAKAKLERKSGGGGASSGGGGGGRGGSSRPASSGGGSSSSSSTSSSASRGPMPSSSGVAGAPLRGRGGRGRGAGGAGGAGGGASGGGRSGGSGGGRSGGSGGSGGGRSGGGSSSPYSG